MWYMKTRFTSGFYFSINQFKSSSINSNKDKSKSRSNDGDYKKAGRPSMLNGALLVKVKDIALGTLMSGGVINRK